jgi:UDP-N-acetylmuramate--alanine ligase
VDIKSFHNIYFIGIGGIGMSAIARFLHSIGVNVYGYDKTATHLTDNLQNEGIPIVFEDELDNIPGNVDLVIYTPAIPKSNRQLNWFKESEIPVIKRAEALGWISRSARTIAVAGTHGKTTTSSIIAQILKNADVSFSAFLGGISYGLGSNYLNHGDEWVVVEADEYDRSFLHLSPDIAVLLSMDADHLDIYGDHEIMKDGFWAFILKIKDGGKLIFKHSLESNFPNAWQEILSKRGISWISFGTEDADVIINNIHVEDERFLFDYIGKDLSKEGIKCRLPGKHNIENATAALITGSLLGIGMATMANSLETFPGVFRRFERMYSGNSLVYIDDYAHHPTELNAAINAARELYPNKTLLGIFQPHLYSRTMDFADGFAEALSKLDYLIMMEIYPAREEPIEGVSSEMILSKVLIEKKELIIENDKIIERLREFTEGVILTLGAGDIDLLRNQIIKMLKEND